MPDLRPQTLSDHAKTTCLAHVCPKCGVGDHVTVEQVLTGKECITRCHCRACGYSWHPVSRAAAPTVADQ